MRHRHDRAGVFGEEPLEPGDRLRVEMVRRLVQQEQVGRAEEEAAERDPPPFAARQRGHVAVAFGQAQRVHRPVERGVQRPQILAVDLVLDERLLGEQGVEVRIGLGEAGRDRVETVEQLAQRADAVLDVFAHVLVGIELGFLLQEADRRAWRELRHARGGLLATGHDPKQRRLAGAVRTEHSDLRSGQEAQRDVCQHLPVRAVELVGPEHRVDVVTHGRPRYPGPGRRP